jgi:hypothetical protein
MSQSPSRFPWSAQGRRGFGSMCGCARYFARPAQDGIGTAMGTLDGVTGTRADRQIFVAECGDYRGIGFDLRQYRRMPE